MSGDTFPLSGELRFHYPGARFHYPEAHFQRPAARVVDLRVLVRIRSYENRGEFAQEVAFL
jgi:hypothetical protein